jgi:S-adenosylmethionine hydrolase
MSIITLITDFGTGDYDIGVLHGVIWGIAPEAQVVNLSHDIARHNVLQAALVLERAVPFFPPGTVHVVVVDPGVGTRRRGLAACLDGQYFVGPDNGLLTPLLLRARQKSARVEIVTLDQPCYWLPVVSPIFHGRDVFTPVAAHLANGVALSVFGSPVSDPWLVEIPQPQVMEGGWRGSVMHIDAFGNLGTNLERQHLTQNTAAQVRLCGETIQGIVRTFGDCEPGQLVALFDSSGKLSVCVVNGNAAQRLQARVGDCVEMVDAS